ncbi:MAG: polar amino acid transport system substrate-binding protein [Paraglaciecola sp.]|jgi:polar amino acid transport system substrate-binding protein
MKKVLCMLLVVGSSFCTYAQNLRVVTEEFPPYQTVVKGELISGTSFFIVKEMLNRAKFNTRIELLPWARAYAIANTKPNVIIFSIARNSERESNFHWLYKLENLNYYFYALTARKDLQINKLSEMFKHTIVAVRGSFEANSLLKRGFVKNKNLILSLNYRDAWQMVMLGRAEFTYANQLIEDEIFESSNGKSALFSREFSTGESSELYVAASANTDDAILKRLKISLLSMQQDGSIK